MFSHHEHIVVFDVILDGFPDVILDGFPDVILDGFPAKFVNTIQKLGCLICFMYHRITSDK